ncbi:MAG: single-stranded DNA-binding protein [Hallerella sp.]|jgi:single-strand DNA-binding protein|nr:single-stranded DNA-binding protein [Fibrobacter sp.]MDY6369221.1 single-stranded DNA-binding protein [Fibrobacter sp.]MDY6389976.1 single-stranded DNA-binding protein [Fibrobacter sp.]MEE3339781.1 single-stranded DNA-binding protein [Hallerella sp.]
MPYLNKVMLIGNIGKDPETKVTPSGRKRVSFSLATSRRYRDASGETREQTDWHNIVGWGKIADIIEQLGVHKGMTLYVEGTLTYRSWDDQNGQKRYATDVNMDTFQLLTPRGGQGGSSFQGGANFNRQQSSTPSYGRSPSINQGMSQPPMDVGPDMEDDLPF